MMLHDQIERQQATDPSRSFIVQAPAGSGKTEILTQRFLRLLALVQAPEQIIALTFTRKAANEMRERIVLALQKADRNEIPASKHQQQTFDYACQALKQDKLHNWQLLTQPSRLRIFTLDSLCQRLLQAMPLQEKQIPYAGVSENPQKLYGEAAQACMDYALKTETYHWALKQLLWHLDNQQARLLTLFSDLLAKRDQWLAMVHEARMLEKEHLEYALTLIEQHELERFIQSIPEDNSQTLLTLVRQLAELSVHADSPKRMLRDLNHWQDLNRESAAVLSETLLTSQGGLRKSFDHHVGLKKGVCHDDLYYHLKSSSKSLFETLTDASEFLESLQRIRNLPSPVYAAKQWDVLQALFTLLPLLAAHLHLVFMEHNEVDFAAISEQALQALGSELEPTDLALYLDHQIHHLLVDEFQDTSIQQYHLLRQLVAGWMPDDGKTLFVVGDPMQSIYRFRAAEVGLFLRVQQQGIGPVQLTPLELKCNFRSTNTIVDWVNHHFHFIFPKEDDMESGAIRFHSSVATQFNGDNGFIKAKQFKNSKEEANAILALVQEELEAHPDDTLAILVRSRNELKHIMATLRAADIPVQGVDIELLAHMSHIRDAWTLTQALLMPANRLVWLALLRSRWCGLTLADCHRIANFSKRESILHALEHLDEIEDLTEDALKRAGFLYQVVDEALTHRCQQSLVEWVNSTLIQLHMDIILNTDERDDLERLWQLVEQFEHNGQIADPEALEKELKKLFSQKVVPSRLQVMTIHKSKGLEFDCVMLPGLGARAHNPDKPLMRWIKLPTKAEDILLVSPVKAAENEGCLVYDYLEGIENQKDHYEMQRLLYVAATRAKKRLYLLDNREKITQGSLRHLLKSVPFQTPNHSLSSTEQQEPCALPKLHRLPIDYYACKPSQSLPNAENKRFQTLELETTISYARVIGIVTHELLQWICTHHPASFDEIPWELVHHGFKVHGIGDELAHSLKTTLTGQMKRLFDSPQGQWFIKEHLDERNEYELLIKNHNQTATRIIDRMFLENGIRWIIDFKTGRDDEKALVQHQKQVNEYAELIKQRFNHPVSCGLYYLATGKWVSWAMAEAIDR